MGKEVITHTDAVGVPGWSGAGYILYDPQVGDGAFKIGGGQNGGWAGAGFVAGFGIGMVISGLLELPATAFGYPYWSGYLLIVTFLTSYFLTSLIIAVATDPNFSKDDLGCLIGGFLAGLSVGLAFTSKIHTLVNIILAVGGWQLPSNSLPQCVKPGSQ